MNIMMLTYQRDRVGSTQSMIYLSEGLTRRGHWRALEDLDIECTMEATGACFEDLIKSSEE